MNTLMGRVIKLDVKNNSGLIEDSKGREYIFTQFECKNDEMPEVGSLVSFIKDPDFKTINVALCIHPDTH